MNDWQFRLGLKDKGEEIFLIFKAVIDWSHEYQNSLHFFYFQLLAEIKGLWQLKSTTDFTSK